jgi:predicted small secreted protein
LTVGRELAKPADVQGERLLMRKLIVFAAAAAALLVASCNTVSGVGKDVSAAGRAVSHTAEDAKH